ncbi:MAG: VOC family protein, partial [Pseudonocardiaceae bacterium]
ASVNILRRLLTPVLLIDDVADELHHDQLLRLVGIKVSSQGSASGRSWWRPSLAQRGVHRWLPLLLPAAGDGVFYEVCSMGDHDLVSVVEGVLARVAVADIDAALPVYEQLSDSTEMRRFRVGDVELAWVGDFLLLSGSPEAIEKYHRVATLLVNDIHAAAAIVVSAGGVVLEGPGEAPNGPRMIARHPDGAIFEYIEPR